VSLFCCALLAIGFLLLIQPKGSMRERIAVVESQLE
jgi:hypothetical protein